jgi:hypothetical protein
MNYIIIFVESHDQVRLRSQPCHAQSSYIFSDNCESDFNLSVWYIHYEWSSMLNLLIRQELSLSLNMLRCFNIFQYILILSLRSLFELRLRTDIIDSLSSFQNRIMIPKVSMGNGIYNLRYPKSFLGSAFNSKLDWIVRYCIVSTQHTNNIF